MFRSAGGRLQRMASGVDRSQAGFAIWGPDPVKEISQTCGLKRHCKAREETLDRRMVTAAKHVYSTWQFANDRRSDGNDATHWNRPAPQQVHLLPAAGERQELLERVEGGEPAGFCEEA